MAGVILRTAGGTLLFAVFLWLVRVDDYRVAGMLLTFPMLNGIGLLGAGPNAERLAKSMTPVVALNGVMCFALTWVLAQSPTARAHPGLLIALTTMAWFGVYAVLETRNVAFTRSSSLAAFAAASVVACLAITYWLWPPCASVPTSAVLRAGGLAGVMEGWATVALFAASLAIFFGFAHRFQHAHAAIGRLAALPIVPLFGLYTAATVLWSDPAAPAKLETMRSMVLIGWMIAVVFVVVFSQYLAFSTSRGHGAWQRVAGLIAGWALCLGCIAGSAKIATVLAACSPA